MTPESQPGPKRSEEEQEQIQSSEQRRRTTYAEITIAALTGEISATHLVDPQTPTRGSTSGIWTLEKALPHLAQGGYVFDLRPLAEHPQLFSWVFQAPMPNGRIEGNDIDRFPEYIRVATRDLAPWMAGAFQDLALLIANGVGEPTDGGAGAFDMVSASYRAVSWGTRGALIGRRIDSTLYWFDGKQQPIE